MSVRYLHSKYLVHSNIRPSNILLTITNRKCEIVLSGFEKSLFSLLQLTIPPREKTPYTAPELISTNKVTVTNKIDIWSCGVVIYKLFTNKENLKLYAIKDKCIYHLVKSMTEVNPDKRYSAKRCLTHLTSW